MLCIQKLGSFEYTLLLVSLKPFPLSFVCVCVKILSTLKRNLSPITYYKNVVNIASITLLMRNMQLLMTRPSGFPI